MKAIGRGSKRLVWQGKSLFRAKAAEHLADQLIGNDSAVMLLHDEGGMHQVKEWHNHVLKAHRIEFLRKRNINRVCVWGERQAKVISEYAQELRDVISVTGSPRFDLCLPSYSWVTRDREDAIKQKHGDYILVCTRFATAAHSQGQGDPFRRKMNPALWPRALNYHGLADVWFSKWQRDVHDFADFTVLIKEIAVNFPQYTLVLRPHPSENLTFYEQAFSAFNNVVVTRDESVLPWIRSAKVVVHSNCTTGIEGVLAGRPVVNLLPESPGRSQLDVEVAREAGYVAPSVSEALKKTGEFLSGELPAYQWSAHAKTILNNLNLESIPMVAAETMGVLQEAQITSSKITLPKGSKVYDAVRRLVRRGATTYGSTKRGPLNGEYVEMIIDGYRSGHRGAGGQIRCLAEKYVVIDPA